MIRFWDSIGIGLAGGEHYYAASLNLPQGQAVTNFTRADVSVHDAMNVSPILMLLSQLPTSLQPPMATCTASI